jgi:hypothetical protein
MSDEERTNDEPEVEVHVNEAGANDEPAAEDEDDEVDAHIHRTANVRMDSPSNS